MENLGSLSLQDRKKISQRLERLNSSKNIGAVNNYLSEKAEFEKDLNRIAFSYYNFKLQHNGIVSYKKFENIKRKVSINSLLNLNNYNPFSGDENISSIPFDSALGYLGSEKEIKRKLSEKQSKECKKYCSKLCYYSKSRSFESKKSGKYKFKIAFLTLGAPDNTTTQQFLKAFDLFLDYLRRTANCVYVWKKEFGSKSGLLHVHIMLNNFIPYYIVSWKWKRLLISQGVVWPKNNKGQDTESHYRIELPQNSKQVGGYMAKYMSKINYVPENIGYLWGKSKILEQCKETVIMEGEVNSDEFNNIYKSNKTIGDEYVKIVLCDLRKIKNIAPTIFEIFEKQFFEFQEKISLPQRFQYV